MKESYFQVYGLGQCSLDYIGKIETYPPPDVKCEFTDMVIQGGGPVATAMVALARWGISCTFAGIIGDDLFGTIIRSSLNDEGVDTSGIIIRKGTESQFAFIVAEPENGRRTIFWRRPTGLPPEPGEINHAIIRRARVLHIDGLFAKASLDACKTAKEAEVPIVVDAGTLREGMLDIARISDYFLASETFARAFVGKDQPLEACCKLAELGPKVVAVTLGSQGYIAIAEGEVIKRPAFPVKAVDTTGCGDVFHAGFIYGLIQGWNINKCLTFAAWAAAKVCLKLGGRAGIPPVQDLNNFDTIYHQDTI